MIARQNPRELVNSAHSTAHSRPNFSQSPRSHRLQGQFHELSRGNERVGERGAALALHVPEKSDVLVVRVRGAELRRRPALQFRLPASLRGSSARNRGNAPPTACCRRCSPR